MNEATILTRLKENEMVTIIDSLRCTRELRPKSESEFYTKLIDDFKKILLNAEDIRQEEKPQERNKAENCPECHDVKTISTNNE